MTRNGSIFLLMRWNLNCINGRPFLPSSRYSKYALYAADVEMENNGPFEILGALDAAPGRPNMKHGNASFPARS